MRSRQFIDLSGVFLSTWISIAPSPQRRMPPGQHWFVIICGRLTHQLPSFVGVPQWGQMICVRSYSCLLPREFQRHGLGWQFFCSRTFRIPVIDNPSECKIGKKVRTALNENRHFNTNLGSWFVEEKRTISAFLCAPRTPRSSTMTAKRGTSSKIGETRPLSW